jgi:Derlin-2/3
MDDFRSLPPVARTLTALTFIQSALVLSGSVSSFWVPFYPQLIFTWRIWPQIWRFVTPFLMTDPKLNFVFDLYFMYTYSSRLEFGSPRFSTPGSFLVYVIFIGSVIMVSLRYSSLKYIYQNNRTLPTTIFSTSLHPTLPSPSQNLAYLPAQPSSS